MLEQAVPETEKSTLTNGCEGLMGELAQNFSLTTRICSYL
jgi:hypothetical protein